MTSRMAVQSFACVVLGASCCLLVGCKPSQNLTVTLRNDSKLELRNVRVELLVSAKPSSMWTIKLLKPGEVVDVWFHRTSGEGSFEISAEGSDGTTLKQNDGYVDHSITQAEIRFEDDPQGGFRVRAEQTTF